MSKKKILVSEAVKGADVSKVEDCDGIYRIDLVKDHNYSVDVEATGAREARKIAVSSINEMPDSVLPDTLKKDS